MVALSETRTIHGYDLCVSNPPMNSDKLPLLQQINDKPQAMWEVMKQEQDNDEGWMEPLDDVAYAVFPTNQYVPEEGEGAHYMLTFDLSHEYAKPHNTPREALVTASEQLDLFLNDPDAVGGYNMYYGRRDVKPPSMSWRNWHIHCVSLRDEDLQPRQKKDVNQREPGDNLRDDFFKVQFERMRESDSQALNTLNYAQILTSEEEKQFRYPFNGVVARMPYMQPADIAQSFLDIDTLCKKYHKEIFDVTVANYDEVAESHWRKPYVMRPEEEAIQRIAQSSSVLEQQFLIKAHLGITRGLSAKRPKDAIYPGPCYSVSVFKDNESMVYVVDPHSFRRNGALEALGVTLVRMNNDNISTALRSKRAHDALHL